VRFRAGAARRRAAPAISAAGPNVVVAARPFYTLHMLKSLARAVAIPIALLGLFSGCGLYSFSGNTLPSHIKTIAVPIFQNDSKDPQIGNEVTDAITQRFLTDNRLKIAGEKRADAVLEGKVISYENKVYNYTSSQTPESYIVVIRIAATLRDASKNKEIWKDDQMTVSAVYSVIPNTVQPLNDEASARAKAETDLAEDVLAHTFEQW